MGVAYKEEEEELPKASSCRLVTGSSGTFSSASSLQGARGTMEMIWPLLRAEGARQFQTQCGSFWSIPLQVHLYFRPPISIHENYGNLRPHPCAG